MSVGGQFHVRTAFTPGERFFFTQVIGDWVTPQNWSGLNEDKGSFMPFPEIQHHLPGNPARSLVTIATELSRFLSRK
jgi:hypothetical protein